MNIISWRRVGIANKAANLTARRACQPPAEGLSTNILQLWYYNILWYCKYYKYYKNTIKYNTGFNGVFFPSVIITLLTIVGTVLLHTVQPIGQPTEAGPVPLVVRWGSDKQLKKTKGTTTSCFYGIHTACCSSTIIYEKKEWTHSFTITSLGNESERTCHGC